MNTAIDNNDVSDQFEPKILSDVERLNYFADALVELILDECKNGEVGEL